MAQRTQSEKCANTTLSCTIDNLVGAVLLHLTQCVGNNLPCELKLCTDQDVELVVDLHFSLSTCHLHVCVSGSLQFSFENCLI